MQVINRLRQQHEQLAGFGDDFRRAVESDQPVKPARFLYLRLMFAQALDDYLARAEEVLSPRQLSHYTPRIAAVAKQLRSEDMDLAERVESYLRRWCLATIEQNWLQFRADTHGIINVVQRRITKEHLLLLPLFSDDGHEDQFALAA